MALVIRCQLLLRHPIVVSSACRLDARPLIGPDAAKHCLFTFPANRYHGGFGVAMPWRFMTRTHA